MGRHAILWAPLNAPPPTLRCRFVRGPLRPPHGGQQFLKVAAQYDPPNFVSLSMERPSLPGKRTGKLDMRERVRCPKHPLNLKA